MQTSIEWTATWHPILQKWFPGYTFNSWWGCEKISQGCKHCYADGLDDRWHHENRHWGPGSSRLMQTEDYWQNPIKWNDYAKKLGIRLKVFTLSMGDVAEDHPDIIQARQRLFLLIEQTPYLNWLLLSKRCDRFMEVLPERWKAVESNKWELEIHPGGRGMAQREFIDRGNESYYMIHKIGNYLDPAYSKMPRNVWLGGSVCENKEIFTNGYALLNAAALLAPSKVFISFEPLLGPMTDIEKLFSKCIQPDWALAGGESGKKKTVRPMHPKWAIEVRDVFHKHKKHFLFKQWGEYGIWDEGGPENVDVWLREDGVIEKEITGDHPGTFTGMVKIGKGQSGRSLNGITYDEMPTEYDIIK